MENKRLKAEVTGPKRRRFASKIFNPFRTIGVVTNNVPCSVTTLGQSFTVSTVVGRSFQIYDASNLHLLFVSQPQADQDIDCIATHFQYQFVCFGNTVALYKRARLEARHDFTASSRARKIVIFGGFVCVLTSEQVHVFKWDPKSTSSLELYTTITLPKVLGTLVDALHMPTYLNKLLIATSSCLVLVNIKTGSVIHTFDDIPAGLRAIEACPVALDVIAAVDGAGTVRLFNIRKATVVLELSVGENVTCVSFRSDGLPLLGVGTASGDVFFYDLNLKRRVHSLKGLHGTSAVTSLDFLTGQSIALSCGADNQMIELAFDPPLSKSVGSGRARVLRQRGGHSKPPSCLMFADPVGDGEASFILSGSLDEKLWSFSLRRDNQSHKFSTGKSHEVPAIIDMAYQREKQDRWGTLLTVHKGENYARVWSAKRGKILDLQLPTGDSNLAKAVTVSQCGNFGAIGSAGGTLSVYNLQSGLHRRTITGAHSQAVSSVTIDPTNSVLISTGLDGRILWSDFRSGKELASLDVGSGITNVRYHVASGLLAASLDSMAIIVVDTAAHKVVRQLWGHGNRITSIDWSPDGRLIMSASLDGTIRTWDVPTSGCVDAVALETPATCLRLSPQGDWMVTSHISGVGLQLWSLRTQFHPPPTRHISDEELAKIETLALPTVSGQSDSLIDDSESEDDEEDIEVVDWDSPDQLAPQLETLSLEPRVKFNTLIHLDAIKARNKPAQVAKKPEHIPFFLTMPTPADSSNSSENQQLENQYSNGEKLSETAKESEFARFMREGNTEALMDCLATLGPAAADLEIRSLDTQEAPYIEIARFIDALTLCLQQRRKFELVQAWAHMLFHAHADIINDESLQESLNKWLDAERSEIGRMQEHQRFCAGVLTYLRTL